MIRSRLDRKSEHFYLAEVETIFMEVTNVSYTEDSNKVEP